MRTFLCAAAAIALATPAHADELPSLSIYGFLRVDTIVDDSALSDPRAPRFVPAESGGSDAELVMHARLSRVGLQIDEWDVSSHTTCEGQVELDFFGGDDGVRLRHAWAALHPNRKVEVLLGQTWDLISPLYPLASPATLLWDAGNSGGFRPQLRLTVTASDRVRIAAAIAGHGGPDGATGADIDGDGQVDGEAGALPMAQFLFEYRQRVGRGEPARVGAWGHVARAELASGLDEVAYSIGAHLFLPILGKAALLGEVTHGRNLAAIGGGLGHGIHPVRLRGVHGTGGWVEVTMTPTKRVLVAEGLAIDSARRDDLEVGDRVRNLVGYVAMRLRPRDTVEVGVEGSFWYSQYKTPSVDDEPVAGRALRLDVHAAVLF